MVAQLVKNLPAMQEPLVQFLGQEDTLEKGFLGFPGGSDNKESACADSKESACNAGDLGSIPGLGRSPGGGHGNPPQYSHLENPMDRGAWATVQGVTKGRNTTEVT